MKYKKFSILNECIDLAIKLNVKYHASQRGMSINRSNGTNKFFDLDSIYLTKGEDCKKYIRESVPSSYQTTLSAF